MASSPLISTTLTPGTFLATVEDPKPGAIVVIHSRGLYRQVEVTAVGPKRVQTAYVTREGGTVTRPAVSRADVYRTCWGDDPALAGVIRQRGARSQYLEV